MSSLSDSGRTELVISITLAETFLLLLFVVWYGFTPVLNSDPAAQLKDRVDQLERENERLASDLRDARDKIADRDFRLDFLRRYLGLPPGFDERKVGAGSQITAACKEACRSNPTCDRQNNVLIAASVVYGRTSIEVLTFNPPLSKWMGCGYFTTTVQRLSNGLEYRACVGLG